MYQKTEENKFIFKQIYTQLRIFLIIYPNDTFKIIVSLSFFNGLANSKEMLLKTEID